VCNKVMGYIGSMFSYFKEVKREFLKVSWLGKKDLYKLLLVVLVGVVVMSLFLLLVDAVLYGFIGFLF